MPVEQVGVEERFAHVEDKDVQNTFGIIKNKILNMHFGDKVPKEVHHALILFSSEWYQEFFLDVKLYMESCQLCSEYSAEAFLITDDLSIFHVFSSC